MYFSFSHFHHSRSFTTVSPPRISGKGIIPILFLHALNGTGGLNVDVRDETTGTVSSSIKRKTTNGGGGDDHKDDEHDDKKAKTVR